MAQNMMMKPGKATDKFWDRAMNTFAALYRPKPHWFKGERNAEGKIINTTDGPNRAHRRKVQRGKQ